MSKTDKSIHDICIASIKRSTMKPYDFKFTTMYESNDEFPYAGLQLELEDKELLICSTFIDAGSFSVLTTRRVITLQDDQFCSINIKGAADKLYGDFKGYRNKDYTLGLIELPNGTEAIYFIETGKASMVMIQGVRTLIKILN